MEDDQLADGGDPACWLEQICERCGTVIEPPNPHDCEVESRAREASGKE